jgi:hypothetical protein
MVYTDSYTKGCRSSDDIKVNFFKDEDYYKQNYQWTQVNIHCGQSKMVAHDSETWKKVQDSFGDYGHTQYCCRICRRKRAPKGHKLKIEGESSVHIGFHNHSVFGNGSVMMCWECRAFDRWRWTMRIVCSEIEQRPHGWVIDNAQGNIWRKKREWFYIRNIGDDKLAQSKFIKVVAGHEDDWQKPLQLDIGLMRKNKAEFEAQHRGEDCVVDTQKARTPWWFCKTMMIRDYDKRHPTEDYLKYKKCAEILDKVCWRTDTRLGVAMYNFRLKKDGLEEFYE